VLRLLNDALLRVSQFERRFDPFFRPLFDALFREPLANLVQRIINARRRREDLRLAAERVLPGEDACVASIIEDMGGYMRAHYQPGGYQRAGNTKTHGIVRGELTIRDDVPPSMRHGIFATARAYRAWVRFGGPGPASPPDIDDVGVLSIGIKLVGVDGPKLLDDEKFTQDFTGISTPTFTTPNVIENRKLQKHIRAGTPLFYFLTHPLDGAMSGLWARTQTSPLETEYWSCVPYLLGEGQAMQYMLRPRSRRRTRVPRLPFRPPDNYLRDAMVKTLASEDVELDFYVKVQTDAFAMPIENASVRWPDSLAPWVPVAVLRLPRQTFDSPAQLAFANNLSFNPWHCIAEHRPLGNQNRGRRAIYETLSQFRQQMNATPHVEPTGEERFQLASPAAAGEGL
jgi:hypothetical protein